MTDTPLGLHASLVEYPPGSASGLVVAVWFERFNGAAGIRAQSGPRSGLLVHPGAFADAPGVFTPPSSWREGRVAITLPRFGNGHPVPLPGVLGGLGDLAGIRFSGRTQADGEYQVPVRVVPPREAVTSLGALVRAWRERYGDACVDPQAHHLARLFATMRERVLEGPLLPTRYVPVDATTPRGAWVPAVTLHELQSMLRPFARIGRAATREILYGRPHWTFHGPVTEHAESTWPVRFARFATEHLDALVSQLVAPTRAEVPPDPVIASLHAQSKSCLHPLHPLNKRPAAPAEDLTVRAEPLPTSTGEAPRWKTTLTLESRDASVPVSWLAEHARGEAGLVTPPDGPELVLPGVNAQSRWEEFAHDAPWFLRDPGLLADGSVELSDVDVQPLLRAPIAHNQPYWVLAERLDRLGFPTTRRRPTLRTLPARSTRARLAIEWEPVRDPATWDAQSDDLLTDMAFRPVMRLRLDEAEFDLDIVRALLAATTRDWVNVGEKAVPRTDLEDLVALADARARVLSRLEAAQGVSWSRVMALEDEWVGDDRRVEVAFAAQWKKFLSELRDAQGLETFEVPAGAKVTLRPYQSRGAAWLTFMLTHGLGACLADDMGLGKTVQVLVALAAKRAKGKSRGADLVVCPTSVVNNWVREAGRFVPRLKVHAHHEADRAGTDDDFRAMAGRYDVVVTSFAIVRRDRERFEATKWDTLVIDEAQNIKNPEAQQTRTLKALDARRRLALTGTPVENHLRDLWSIYDVVMPGLLGGFTRFTRSFATPARDGDPAAMERLRWRVGPFLLRRTKRDPTVAGDLPPRLEQDVDCTLTREQAALYQSILDATFEGITDRSGMQRRAHILAALTGLKQVCNHPENYAREKPTRLAGRSGKLDRFLELVGELLEESEPTLVFTQYREMGEIISRALSQRYDLDAPFFHGGLSPLAREDMVAEFQSEDGPPVMVVSLKAGGSGLNLTRATTVIHYDRWWNPAVEDQATDRAHRIGQTRTVNVYRFVTQGTLEERIQEMLDTKRALSDNVLGDGGERWLTEMSDDELKRFLSFDGASAQRAEEGVS